MRKSHIAGIGIAGAIGVVLLLVTVAIGYWAAESGRVYTLSVDSDRTVKVVVSVLRDAPHVTQEHIGKRFVLRNSGIDYWDVTVHDEAGKKTDNKIYDLSVLNRKVRIRGHRLVD